MAGVPVGTAPGSVQPVPARSEHGQHRGALRPMAAASGLGGLCSPGCYTVADAALLFFFFFSILLFFLFSFSQKVKRVKSKIYRPL